jgi:hypothetical protein
LQDSTHEEDDGDGTAELGVVDGVWVGFRPSSPSSATAAAAAFCGAVSSLMLLAPVDRRHGGWTHAAHRNIPRIGRSTKIYSYRE